MPQKLDTVKSYSLTLTLDIIQSGVEVADKEQ